MLRTELEILTGKLIRGDLTAIVYELVKDSPFKSDLIQYSSLREEMSVVNKKRSNGDTNDNSSIGPSFKDWICNEVQCIPKQRQRESKRRCERTRNPF